MRRGWWRRCGAVPKSPFWHIKGMSVVDHVNDYADVPVLHVTGWYDSWTRQVTMNYEALAQAKKSPQRLMIGPWVHGGAGVERRGRGRVHARRRDRPPAPSGCAGTTTGSRGSNGVDDDPPVMIYVMGTGDDRRSKAGRLQHGGSWREEREWPLARPGRRRITFEPMVRSRPPSSEPEQPDHLHVRSGASGADDRRQHLVESGADGGRRVRPATAGRHPRRRDRLPLSERRDVLVFRTRSLPADLEVTGTVRSKLWISSTALDTDFTAKLIDEVPPNSDYPLGFDLNIGDSILRTRIASRFDSEAAAAR